ncbi:MAG: hypothetical protein ACI90V_012897, partial [Bacillariaceae sp.]
GFICKVLDVSFIVPNSDMKLHHQMTSLHFY